MLGWSAGELASESLVGATTIRRYEMLVGIPQGNVNVLMKLQSFFESSGIQFTGDPLINPEFTLDLSKREASLGRQ